jgi:urease accessory protein
MTAHDLECRNVGGHRPPLQNVPIENVGRHGRLNLAFALHRGRTILRDAYCEVPFKITRLHESSSLGLPHLILMHCTAGLFGGDKLECSIRVERGARILLTQQSATKVHPSCAGPAAQSTRIYVESDAELHLYCDPIIPFAGARLHQVTSIEAEPGARLCFWESFMAGRVGHGEVWEFDELASETQLRSEGRLLYLDRFLLRPRQHHPASDWAMSHFRYFGSGLYFGEDAAALCDRLHVALPEAGVDSPVAGVTAVRVLGDEGHCFRRSRQVFAETVGIKKE